MQTIITPGQYYFNGIFSNINPTVLAHYWMDLLKKHSRLPGYPRIIEVTFQADWIKNEIYKNDSLEEIIRPD